MLGAKAPLAVGLSLLLLAGTSPLGVPGLGPDPAFAQSSGGGGNGRGGGGGRGGGASGSAGASSSAGSRGGPSGSAGASGSAGSRGAGASGSVGNRGSNSASAGASGSLGNRGANGASSSAGSRGNSGSAGASGSVGGQGGNIGASPGNSSSANSHGTATSAAARTKAGSDAPSVTAQQRAAAASAAAQARREAARRSKEAKRKAAQRRDRKAAAQRQEKTRVEVRKTPPAERSMMSSKVRAQLARLTLSKAPSVPNEVIAAGLDETQLAGLRKRGFAVRKSSAGRVSLRVPRGVGLEAAAAQILQANPAARVDANHYYYPAAESAPCSGGVCAATAAIKWSQPEDGCGMPIPAIGIIDTAINRGHPALKGRSVEVLSGGASATAGSNFGHGTLVASLVLGLLPHARIIAVDAFDRDEAGRERTDAMTLVSAIEDMKKRGVRVINMSLTGPDNSVLSRAVAEASAAGVILVAAAGNGGANSEASYPAAYNEVLSVTAVDADLNLYRRASTGNFVDIAAPGVDIVAGQDGGAQSGTSFAVPFVTGAAALLASVRPEWSSAKIQADLKTQARDLGAPGRDDLYGWGLLQAENLCNADAPLVAGGDSIGTPAAPAVTSADALKPAAAFTTSGD